jgi:hypothetical protein
VFTTLGFLHFTAFGLIVFRSHLAASRAIAS